MRKGIFFGDGFSDRFSDLIDFDGFFLGLRILFGSHESCSPKIEGATFLLLPLGRMMHHNDIFCSVEFDPCFDSQ